MSGQEKKPADGLKKESPGKRPLGKERGRWWMTPVFVTVTVLVIGLAVWGPEALSSYHDRMILEQIREETLETGMEGYRYSLNANEKLYILSRCLEGQIQPESELSAMTRLVPVQETDYEEFTGNYAFVVSRQELGEEEISQEEIYEACSGELDTLKELEILPDEVRPVTAGAYSAVLYSAIDVPEPRNNVLVWKVSLSTSQQTANKANRLLDAYVDADTGKLYEFYVRTPLSWSEIDTDDIIEKWSRYMGLTDPEPYEPVNPLSETTPYFQKYIFSGMEEGNTVVTVGFYEGINELFLKISR